MNIENYLDSIGSKGSTIRLEAIASNTLRERSIAAQKVLEKRSKRLELMKKGFSYPEAVLIVKNEYLK